MVTVMLAKMCASFLVAAVTVAVAANPLGPGSGKWAIETPESHGMTKEGLEAGKEYLFSAAKRRTCMVVIKDGALVYEAGKNKAGLAWSITKSLGAMLIGRGATTGHLDIDESTAAYGVNSPVAYETTPSQIMSSVIAGDQPGDKWEYDETGSFWINVLPDVLSQATSRKPADIWDEDFARPLGLSRRFKWRNANKNWGYGSRGTCKDFARIGQLLLNKGKWIVNNDVENILSEEYVNKMTTPYENSPNSCYGFLTWLGTRKDSTQTGDCLAPPSIPYPREHFVPKSVPIDNYFLSGIFGQVVWVVPSENLVAVTMGTTFQSWRDYSSIPVKAQLARAVWCDAMGRDCSL